MGATPRGLLLAICAVLMAITLANASSSEAVAVVVGQAMCADCTRKNMKAEAAFKGVQVAIKCKNSNGEYESKAVGKLDGSGAFAVPVAADLHDPDCLAQLHSASGMPCTGQEPSRIVLMADGTLIAVAGKAYYPSAACASVTISHDHKKHLSDFFHKGHDHDNFHKDHDHHHFFDHFHKKFAPSSPTPEYHQPTPTPIYRPPAKH